MEDFHFLRPLWLILIPLAALLCALLVQQQHSHGNWQKLIDSELLKPLLKGRINRQSKTGPTLILLFFTLAALALAGPSWEKIPQPVFKRSNGLIILFDLSPSMLVTDVKPSRLVAAKRKILDLLNARKEGYTALISYSGDAHIVAPLTDDTNTIATLTHILDPNIMPIHGSNVEHATTLAIDLFHDSGFDQGNILLITDGITQTARDTMEKLLANQPYTLSIIGVGTNSGGPIPIQNGSFAKDSQGNILLPRLDDNLLRSLAQVTNGYYSPLRLDDSDINYLATAQQSLKNSPQTVEREFDQWFDRGAWLALALLPIVAIGFRRGALFSFVLFLPFTLAPLPVEALEWQDLWYNDNQRAMQAMEEQDYERAATLFNNPEWKAAAQYHNNELDAAQLHYAQEQSSTGLYNYGNTLAKNGQLEEAIAVYDKALQQNPDFEDAVFNKKLLEDLLNQQQAQQNQQQDSQQQDSQNNQQQEQPSQSDQQQGEQQSAQQNQQHGTQQEKNQSSEEPDQTAQTSSEQQEAEQEQNEQQQMAQEETDEAENSKENSTQSFATSQEEIQLSEQQQELEQWLRRVPDDPSGLMRNKFEHYYQQRQLDARQGKNTEHLNEERRW